MDQKKRLLWIRILCILAILIAAYLAREHYAKEPSKFCVFGKSWNCDIVNKSLYSNVDAIFYMLGLNVNIPIPNAIVGGLLFVFIFLTTFSIKKNKPLFGIAAQKLIKLDRTLLFFGILYGLFLFYIQAFVLYTYCLFCILLDLVILSSFILFLGLDTKKTSSKRKRGGKRR